MNKLSYNDILDTIEKSTQFTGIASFPEYCEGSVPTRYEHIGAVQCVKESPQIEDCDWWKVIHFVDHDVYIKFEGWYDSYDGMKVNEWYEVEPFEETVISYGKINN
jgi:hypothetical protein